MRVAVIQNVWRKDTVENFDCIEAHINHATAKGNVDIVCLPEFFLGPAWFQPGQISYKLKTDDTIPGYITNRLCHIAERTYCNIVGGTFVERGQNGYYNTSVIISRQGKIIGKSRKVHLFASETKNCNASNTFETYKIDSEIVGVAVCSDFWIYETTKILSGMGATTIFVPGGSLKQNLQQMEAVAQYLCDSFNVKIVMASVVGQISGERDGKIVNLKFSGNSLIADSQGIISRASTDKEEIIFAEI